MASAAETTQASPKGSGITGWMKKKPQSNIMDKSKMAELIVSSQAAYDAELAGQWERAYDLHSNAAEMWSAHAQTAGRFHNIQKIYKRLAVKRADLHRQRLDTLRPFVKNGSPVPEVIPMHPSSELVQIGLWDRIRTEDVPVSLNKELEVLSLTRVGDCYHHKTLLRNLINPPGVANIVTAARTRHPWPGRLWSASIHYNVTPQPPC